MSSMTREAKLAELRAKTDAELVRHVTRQLNLGLRFALELDDRSHRRAEEAYSEIVRLLPIIRLREAERRQLDARLKHLGELLPPRDTGILACVGFRPKR